MFTSSSKIPPVDPTLGLLHHGEHLHSDGQDYISKHHLDIMHISLGNWCKDFFWCALDLPCWIAFEGTGTFYFIVEKNPILFRWFAKTKFAAVPTTISTRVTTFRWMKSSTHLRMFIQLFKQGCIVSNQENSNLKLLWRKLALVLSYLTIANHMIYQMWSHCFWGNHTNNFK